jgi:hypothetical protein
MIINKIIETSIDLKTSDEIFSPDKKGVLLNKLKKRYINVCYQSIFILDIINIIRYSKTRLVDNRLDGGGTVDVMFEARGIMLNKNEVLNGCKVVQIASNAIIAELPVVVDSAMFNPGTSQVTIVGSPYVPIPHNIIYHNITDGLSQVDVEKLKLLIRDFNAELDLHKSIQANKPYELFKDIIYPYKTNQKFEVSQIGSKFTLLKLDINNFTDIDSGCLVYPSNINKTDTFDKFVYYSKEEVNTASISIVDSKAYTALSYMILQRIYYLQCLRGIYEEYDTPEKNQDMMIYWKVCQSLKQ